MLLTYVPFVFFVCTCLCCVQHFLLVLPNEQARLDILKIHAAPQTWRNWLVSDVMVMQL